MSLLTKITRMHYRTKLILIFSLMLLCTSLATSIINSYFSIKTIKEETVDYARITANQITKTMDGSLAKIDRLAVMLINDILIQNINCHSHKQNIRNEYRNYTKIAEIVPNYNNIAPELENIFIYDEDGRLFYQENLGSFSMMNEDIHTNPGYRSFIEHKNQRLWIIVSRDFPFFQKVTQKKVILFRKIIDERNQYQGLVGLAIKTEPLQNSFAKLNLDQRINIYILGAQHEMLFNPPKTSGSQIKNLSRMNVAKLQDGNVIRVKHHKYLAFFDKSKLTGWTTLILIPQSWLLRKIYLTKYISIAISLLLSGLMISVVAGISYLMTRSINQLAAAMKRVESGDFAVRVTINPHDEIGILGQGFNLMLQQINELIEKVVRERTSKQEAELRALQNQINPHFFFNTLETIRMRSLIMGEKETAKIIEHLSQLMHATISYKEDFIRIKQELDHVHSYLVIQNLRYNDRFTLTVRMETSLNNYLIPKLVLQPLVENSINHGFRNTDNPGTMIIKIAEDDRMLFITVWDNGVGIALDRLQRLQQILQYGFVETPQSVDSGGHNGVGLVNVNERLRAYFGPEYGLTLDSVLGEWTQVTFKIPRIKEHSEVKTLLL